MKLHIDENKKNGTFLWIDPPWQFGRDEDIIESSASYPDHEEAGYEEKHRAWCSQFEPAYSTLIEKIDARPDGSLWIFLRDRYAFYIPPEFIPEDPPSWYDHWYFRKQKEPNQTVQATATAPRS